MGSHTITHRHAPQAHPGGFAPTPVLVQWLVTLRCPYRCPHCLAPSGPSDELSTDDGLCLVDQVADAGIEELLLTGGEPLVRPDLPRLLERLGERGQSYSLNTAITPTGAIRDALERDPPAFVAVSLDGPERVHDRFRGAGGAFAGALESIRFFVDLGCRVAAGTTVTRRNVDHLARTFGVVVGSGAHSWGLHLLVPEGRARDRQDLQLSRRQLGGLLRFVARRRPFFDVTLADEFSYCGDVEPLVRNAPLRCGAGRQQAVVLPDGEVVPCTTLDRRTSAGNVRRVPLMDLWRHGFAALRGRRETEACGDCRFEQACGGGCWLLQRDGGGCYRDTWQTPRSLGTAAGIAVCLGMLALPARADAPPPPSEPVQLAQAGARSMRGAGLSIEGEAAGIDGHILHWYAPGTAPGRRGGACTAPSVQPQPYPDPTDPGWQLLEAFRAGRLPDDLVERSAAVREALQTAEPSLGLASLAWRILTEAALDGPPLHERTDVQRRALRDALTDLDRAARSWRDAIYAGLLDPFLARGREHQHYHFEMCKSRPRPPRWLKLARDTAQERWAGALSAEWLEQHPWGEGMELNVAGDGLTLLRAGEATPVDREVAMRIADLLRVGDGGVPVEVGRGDRIIGVALPAGAEVSYGDLLRLSHEASPPPRRRRGGRGSSFDDGVPHPLELIEARQAGRTDWLADFWMF